MVDGMALTEKNVALAATLYRLADHTREDAIPTALAYRDYYHAGWLAYRAADAVSLADKLREGDEIADDVTAWADRYEIALYLYAPDPVE